MRLRGFLYRSGVAPLLCIACALSVGGCKTVRDFLVPPQTGTNLRTNRPNGAIRADLVLRHAHYGAGKTGMVAVGKGRILAVGDEKDVAKFIGPGTPLRDVRAGYLAPAFVDSHVHLDGMALVTDAVDLSGVRSPEGVAAKLLRADELIGTQGWLWAVGASNQLLAKLDADKLDAFKPGLRVWISAADGHAAVVSSALLETLPRVGFPLVKGTHGQLEAVTARAVWRLLPMPSTARARPLILAALKGLAEKGVATVHTMGASLPFVALLAQLERSGRLQTRVLVYLDAEAPMVDRYIAERVARRQPRKPNEPPRTPTPLVDDETHKVKVVGIKLWLDGTLGARTAALSSPYADAPGTKGRLLADGDRIAGLLASADAAGLQLALHAIGDAAVDQVATTLTSASRPPGARKVRIEHAQVVAESTLAKLAKLEVLCATQPLHELDDVKFAASRLGKSRAAWGYRAATLAAVCPVSVGSDAPISRSDPWAMWTHLVARTDGRDTEKMTAGAAWDALMMDPLRGRPHTIAAGAPADLVLWSARPEPGKPNPKRMMMLIDGETLFADGSLPRARIAPGLPR